MVTKPEKREAVDVKEMISRIEKTAERLSRVWPRGLSAVEAVRRNRR